VTGATSVPSVDGRVGILAGSGAFPLIVAKAVHQSGQEPYIFAIAGEANQDWSEFDHCTVSIGNLAAISSTIRRESIGAIVLAGGIHKRPGLRDIRPSWPSLKTAPSALRALLSGGDDKILRAAIEMLEKHGVRVLAAQEVVPGLLTRLGPVGRHRPAKTDGQDIKAAARAALAIGRLDVGQGAVSVGGRVIALEGLEGTDAMLARVADLRAAERLRVDGGGVLVKMCKPDQDRRADLPAIGPETVMNAHAAGLSGIAIEAGRSLVLERERVVSEADRLGIFVTGIESSDLESAQ
jgi:DUF1009 family protein